VVLLFRRISLVATLLCVPAVASAQKPANADRVRSAADEYDAGRRAFNDSKFDEAAVHFENAFRDAPAAAAIRNAITARAKAGHSARAATEAALAQTKYPDDAATRDLVKATLADLEPKLHKTILNCSPECGVVADSRAVSIEDGSRVVFYLDPGDHEVVVSWGEDRTKILKVSAKAANDYTWAPSPPKPKPPPDAVAERARSEQSAARDGRANRKNRSGRSPSSAPCSLSAALPSRPGVDTQQPRHRQRRRCVGWEQCPEYQQGLSRGRGRTHPRCDDRCLCSDRRVGRLSSRGPSARQGGQNPPFAEIGRRRVGLQGSF
jgi:hypothetical protein